MQFTAPTTKVEMYSTLKDIYDYYRLNTKPYEKAELLPLNITRLSCDTLTDEELTQKAEKLIKPAIIREKQKRNDELNAKIDEYRKIETKTIDDYATLFEKIDNEYEKLKEKIDTEAINKGLKYSSITTEKMRQVENEKAQKIIETEQAKNQRLADVNAKIRAVRLELESLDSFYNDLEQKDIEKKFLELKEEQEKNLRDIQKYNNGLDRQEVAYNNNDVLRQVSLELKYMEIKNKGLTKEALVDLGYYADVLDCICAYYDTLTPLAAYNDIKRESSLMLYTEDFYEDLLVIYKTRVIE